MKFVIKTSNKGKDDVVSINSKSDAKLITEYDSILRLIHQQDELNETIYRGKKVLSMFKYQTNWTPQYLILFDDKTYLFIETGSGRFVISYSHGSFDME